MVEKRVKEYLKKLVKTRSLSGGEGELAGLIKDLLSNEGVDKAFIDSYGNVIGVVKGGVDGSIVFEGHMDHVPEGDLSLWGYDPYEAVEVDGRIYGRGAVDMKGAIASMIISAGMIGETKDKPSIYYVFVPHEEIVEGLAFKYAVEETLKIRPDLVVLGEATKLNLHIGQRGRAVIYIDVYGVSAHASMPDKGVNPIIYTGLLVKELHELANTLPSHPLLGRSTITPTIIDCSPESPPMIPDYCRLVVDRRFVIGESRKKIVGEVRELAMSVDNVYRVRSVKVGIPREKIRFWTGIVVEAEHYFPAWIVEDRGFTERILSVLKKVNPEARVGVWRFSTDGVYSAGTAGFKTVGIGPGSEELAHKPNEYVEVKDLVKAVEAYKSIVEYYHLIIGREV